MNYRQRVFDALASMRGSYFNPTQIAAMSSLNPHTSREILKRLFYMGLCERKREEKRGKGISYLYALTETAQRPIDGRSTERTRAIG